MKVSEDWMNKHNIQNKLNLLKASMGGLPNEL